MKMRLLPILALPIFLAACSANMDHTNTVTTAEALANHNWVLTEINNTPLKITDNSEAPTLTLNNTLSASGYSGCNRLFGQAEYKNGQFRIEKMGMTMMACQGEGMKLEGIMSKTLSNWSDVTIKSNTLTLKTPDQTLTFKTAL